MKRGLNVSRSGEMDGLLVDGAPDTFRCSGAVFLSTLCMAVRLAALLRLTPQSDLAAAAPVQEIEMNQVDPGRADRADVVKAEYVAHSVVVGRHSRRDGIESVAVASGVICHPIVRRWTGFRTH